MLRNYRIAAGIAVAFLLVAGSVDAQSKYKVGLKGGVALSKLRGDEVSRYLSSSDASLAGAIDGYRTGGQFGGFLRRHMKNNFSLQLELQFVQKGGEGPVQGVADVQGHNSAYRSAEFNGAATAKLDYIEVPLLAVFDFESDDRVDMVFEAGVVLAFNTSAERKLSGEATTERVDGSRQKLTVDQSDDISTEVNPVDFLGALGLGFEIEMSSYDLLLNGRWSFGFTSIDRTNQTYVHNSTFSITVGLAFPLGS